jgi:hypothetical protein
VVLIDPWSIEFIDFVTANDLETISLRTTVTRGIAWGVGSYSPFRFDLSVAEPILNAKDLRRIEKTTSLLPTLSPGQVEILAARAPKSTLYRNWLLGQNVSRLLAKDLSNDAIDLELAKLLNLVPIQTRAWYRSEMLELVRQQRPAFYRYLLSDGSL